MRPAAFVALVVAMSTPVGAAAADTIARRPASELLSACEAVTDQTAETLAEARCLAFVEGFLWGHGWAAWRESRDVYFCPPDEMYTNARKMVPAIVDYLRSHPQRLDQPAHLMLFVALSNTYPCP